MALKLNKFSHSDRNKTLSSLQQLELDLKLDQVNLPLEQIFSFNLVSLVKELKSFIRLVSLPN